jgi:DNA repair protein RadC
MAEVDYSAEMARLRMRDMPHQLRPREQVERVGVEHVPDDVLLAIILRTGVPGRNVLELARGLIQEFGSLTGLTRASADDIRSRSKGLGPVKVQVLMAALELGRRLGQEIAPRRRKVRSPADVAEVLRPVSRTLENEVFWALLLDATNRLKGRPIDITRGLVDASLVHPREVFRPAVRSSSAAVIIAHNHPSGDPSPSSEDLRITRQVVQAGEVVDIKVLDHIIMGCREEGRELDFLSLREEGLVEF